MLQLLFRNLNGPCSNAYIWHFSTFVALKIFISLWVIASNTPIILFGNVGVWKLREGQEVYNIGFMNFSRIGTMIDVFEIPIAVELLEW